MEALLLIGVLIGLLGLVLAVAFYVRLWRVLGVHGQAMHALHRHYATQRVPRAPLGHIPPQDGPR